MRWWLFWTLLFGSVLANPYAALIVTPHGQQIFDLATGITTLPDGGEVAAREAEVLLMGQRLRFQEGVFVEAEGAEVKAINFTLSAPVIFLDIAQQSLRASGGAVFRSPELTVSAEQLEIDLLRGHAVLSGVVSTSAPLLEAARLLVASDLNAALLVGPYRYQDGPFVLSSSEPGDLLELRWSTTAEGLDFTVSTDISAELLARHVPD